MSNRSNEVKCQEDRREGIHRNDFRNLPTGMSLLTLLVGWS